MFEVLVKALLLFSQSHFGISSISWLIELELELWLVVMQECTTYGISACSMNSSRRRCSRTAAISSTAHGSNNLTLNSPERILRQIASSCMCYENRTHRAKPRSGAGPQRAPRHAIGTLLHLARCLGCNAGEERASRSLRELGRAVRQGGGT